jgi:hypothetical protein
MFSAKVTFNAHAVCLTYSKCFQGKGLEATIFLQVKPSRHGTYPLKGLLFKIRFRRPHRGALNTCVVNSTTVGQTVRTRPSIRTPKGTISSHLVHPESETGVSLFNAGSLLSFLPVIALLCRFDPRFPRRGSSRGLLHHLSLVPILAYVTTTSQITDLGYHITSCGVELFLIHFPAFCRSNSDLRGDISPIGSPRRAGKCCDRHNTLGAL